MRLLFWGLRLDGKQVRPVDCGDVPGDVPNPSRHYSHAEESAGLILRFNCITDCPGGDHGVTIPVLRAFEGSGRSSLH